ncbi:NAD-dependent epimerase/dehydratase family protein [Candidatus Pelagibacter communis]|uniref:NAD dependent epimerase/dehydratase family n=2 Tax=Pelagibacter ubique TaxID=198252 RepID=Q4FN93_PELUB|nr:NAD(P)-dependent oxidoreductase [Candidatus Pelagibacter ubique]AAZ21346.1 NAD dependent epimerase/dehydratase family [Candidatus Pelagibacter ubique HTCC1062]EAS84792.1 NAD dependent epimerase/dehydratase family protein [Candidatus Pelagibacter ubique HTCC1002]
MKILLTGASSYIGQYIILNLLQNNHKILSTSRSDPKIKNKNHKWISHDLSKKPLKLKDFKPDVIIHLAGSAWLNMSSENYVNSNILTTNNLVKTLEGKKFKKVFYLSSRDIYGEVKKSVLNENTIINDPSIYGYTKLIAEKILLNSFPTIILRLPAIIGLGTHGWINSVTNKIKKNKKIILSNSKFNNFMHASELPKIIMKLSKSKINSDIFLVSCSNILKSYNVVKLLKLKLKSKSKIEIKKNKDLNYIISSVKLNRIYKTISVEKVINIYSNELRSKEKYTN